MSDTIKTLRMVVPKSRAQIRTEELADLDSKLKPAALWQFDVTGSPACLQRVEELLRLGAQAELAKP